MDVYCVSGETTEQFFNQMVALQQRYGKGWKEFMVKDGYRYVKLKAFM